MTGSAAAAEDVAQDCFLTLWRDPAAYDPGRGSLRPFLIGVARNLALKQWRAERPLDPVGEERAETVARAVRLLPPLQREAVILAEYEELSLEEISAATASELAAVKSRLHRGRQNLRRMLAPLLESESTTHGTS